MRIISGTFATAMRAFLFYWLIAVPAFAQTYTLSGKVTDTEGHAVPSAKVSAKSVVSGQIYKAETGADGLYTIGDLPGGDYLVSAIAGELKAPPIRVTLAAAQTTDLTVSPAPKGVAVFAMRRHRIGPCQIHSASSLSDVGFPQTQANAQLQAG